MATNIQCPVCGSSVSTNAERCTRCKAELRERPSTAVGGRSAPQVTKCPRCGAGVQRGDVICVACGTNLLTGKRVTVSSASSELSVERSFGDTKTWIWVGSVAAVLAVAFVCMFFFFLKDYTAVGKRMLSEEKYNQAADNFRTAIERQKPSYDAHFYLAITQSLTENYDEAAFSFAEAVKLRPESVDAHMLLGLTHGIRGDYQKEITELERVVDFQPENVDALLLLGLAYGLVNDPEGETSSLREALRIRPLDPVAHYFLGMALSRQEKYDEAISMYRRAIELGYDSTGDAQLALGMSYQAGGAVDQALSSLRNALTLNTQYIQHGHYHLGLAMAAKGLWQQARNELAQAVESQPDNIAASYYLGTAERALDNQPAAAAAYTRVVESGDPTYAPQAHIQLALINLKAGESTIAEDELQQAIAAQPDNVTARVQMGMLLKRQPGRETEAIRAFRAAIDQAPQAPAPHLALAIFYVEKKNTFHAIDEFKQYLRLAPAGAEADAVRRIIQQLEESA